MTSEYELKRLEQNYAMVGECPSDRALAQSTLMDAERVLRDPQIHQDPERVMKLDWMTRVLKSLI